MRLLSLPTVWTVAIDFMVWFIIHIGVVAIMVRIPAKHFNPNHWLYRSRKWEGEGNLYQEGFKIKK